MKYLKIITFLIIFLLNINLCLAQPNQDINIQINVKDTFKINDILNFDYTIISNQDVEIVYIPYIKCEQAPQPFLEEKEIRLKANIPYQDKYSSIKVEDNLEPQTCTAFIQILSPIEKKIEKEFKIETTPSFQFNLQYCKDEFCVEKTKVFVLNNNIYLNYNSDAKNLEITANLIYPNKTEKKIILPTSIKAEQVGNYELEITAKKDGYKTINKKDMFGVIGERVEIQSASICNADGKCLGNENAQNCPQDCLAKAEDNGIVAGIDYKMILVILIIVISIIMIIIYFVIKNRNNRNQFDNI